MEKNSSNPSDPALPYLSEVIDVNTFKKGMLNIIVAPCHSGKTTAAGKIIKAHARRPEHVLYLIDTTAGKESIISHNAACKYTSMWLNDINYEWWGELRSGNGFRVMTYHQFGHELQKYPGLIDNLDLIICDEMHNLVKYMGIEYDNNKKNKERKIGHEVTCCRTAFNTLYSVSKRNVNAPLIVVLTATSNSLVEKLDKKRVPFTIFNYNGKVRHDKTQNTCYYADLAAVIQTLKPNDKVFVYTMRISDMQKCATLFSGLGRNVCCLWGLNNESHEMNEQQLKIRKEILNTGIVPEEVDVLIVNAAYETSININDTTYNTMIVHTQSPDVRIQVRGRLRHDIDTLYLYDKEHENIAEYFPEEYLNRYLYADEKQAIVELMKLRNPKGREMKWPSIAKALMNDGMFVLKDKIKGRHCWYVSESPLTPSSNKKQEVCA